MNTEALVDAVTAAVLKQLQIMGDRAQPTQKKLLLLGNHLDYGWWANKLGASFKVCPAQEERSAGVADYDCILITQLSNQLLDDLFQSIGRSPESSVTIDYLLSGKEVFLLEEGVEYRQFEATAAPSLFQRFREKEQAVISYGVTVVTAANMVSVMKGKDTGPVQTATELSDERHAPRQSDNTQACVIQERVVRESHLLEGIEKGFDRFLIHNNALVTPLAQDCIRLRELNIDKAPDGSPRAVDPIAC